VHPALAKINFDRDVALITAQFLKNRGWAVHGRDFPILDISFVGSRILRVKLTCSEWDELPPAAELLNGDGTGIDGNIPGGVFNASAHPSTGKPFICMRGFREYHTHPSHLGDLWDTYRGQDGMNLPGLLDQLSRAWRKAVGR
jgi:hypothetical protein